MRDLKNSTQLFETYTSGVWTNAIITCKNAAVKPNCHTRESLLPDNGVYSAQSYTHADNWV